MADDGGRKERRGGRMSGEEIGLSEGVVDTLRTWHRRKTKTVETGFPPNRGKASDL